MKKPVIPRGRRALGEPPPYRRHASGRGFVTIGGRSIYFGPHDDQGSRDAYEAFRARWLAEHRQVIAVGPVQGQFLSELLPPYLAELATAISPKELGEVKRNLETVVGRFGAIRPDDFRAAQFKSIRDGWIAMGHARHTIGKAVGRLKRWFRWLVEHEHAKPETYGLLLAIKGLRRGAAPDLPPVPPVPMRDYARTIRRVTPTIRAMARVQLFGGPRPGEICRMRGREIHHSGKVRLGSQTLRVPAGVWVFIPERAKKQEGRTVYFFGPKVQAVLRPFLMADRDAYLFQPKLNGDPKNRSKTECYTPSSYAYAIRRGAKRAGVDHWHPHQLRHSFATRTGELTDLHTLSVLLAHEQPDTTLIYRQERFAKAASVAAKHG